MKIIANSYIDGTFNGWTGSTLFKLANNQYWLQSSYAYNYYYAYRPNAQIIEDDEVYYLRVHGLDDRVPVVRVTDIIESNIRDEFEGWEGESTFELDNGQVWKQTEYAYHYHYAYRPSVVIYNSLSGYRIQVEGVPSTIGVVRIK